MAFGLEGQISSSVIHTKNLISLTSSKYNELNGQATLSEWTKTALLKSLQCQPIGTRRKGRPNLSWIDSLEKDQLVLKIKNWRTLVGKGWSGKSFLRRPRTTLSCRATEEGRKDSKVPGLRL
ncbi:hypothetical protein TNCV_2769531 [Trichonephila clavipes]|nr:hypothetical protein TNCV_2769531 [Trichonephila clavipes]